MAQALHRILLALAVTAMTTVAAMPTCAASSADTGGHLSTTDYGQIGTAILTHVLGRSLGRVTIFVGFDDIRASSLINVFQKLFKPPTVVKGTGEDWGTDEKNGCHFDKATGAPATGVFISSPYWVDDDTVKFSVTFAACAIGTRMDTYILSRKSGQWKVASLKPDFVT
jgi:hypothetical protein